VEFSLTLHNITVDLKKNIMQKNLADKAEYFPKTSNYLSLNQI